MNDIKKLMTIEVPPIAGVSNWVAVSPVHVVRGSESWLVVTIDAGQDNISEKSSAYSTPEVEAWANRGYEAIELSFSYKFDHWLYDGRELVAKLDAVINNGVKIYALHSYGCGLITPEATIYLEGIEVPKFVLPEIPDIKGIDGLYFYKK